MRSAIAFVAAAVLVSPLEERALGGAACLAAAVGVPIVGRFLLREIARGTR